MENQEHSSGRPPKEGWFSAIVHLVLSYYSELVTHPFKTGLAYFAAGLIGVLIVGWFIFPMLLYSSQKQPINFSHAVHLDSDLVDIYGDTEQEKCLECHSFREDGSFTGIPKLDKCTECHDDPEMAYGENPEEERFLTEYVAEEIEVPWLVYSRQPDCVYFSHIAHVNMGEIECWTCHGDHHNTETLPMYKENRISGYSIDIWGRNILGYKNNTWDRMKMDDCAECHTAQGHEENNACFVCHK